MRGVHDPGGSLQPRTFRGRGAAPVPGHARRRARLYRGDPPGGACAPAGPGPHSAFKIHRLCRRKIANVCKISTALVQILDNKKSWFNKMHLAFPWVSRPKKKKNLARIKYRANSRIRWKWWVSDQQVGLETILWGWHFPVNHWNDTLPWCHVQKLKKAIVYQQNRKKAFTIFYLL